MNFRRRFWPAEKLGIVPPAFGPYGFSAVTLEELAEQTGESVEDLSHWGGLGLIPERGSYTAADAERVRLVRFAVDHGYAPEALAELSERHGDMIGHFAGSLGVVEVPEHSYTFEQAAAMAGIEPGLANSLRAAAGLTEQRRAFDDDIEAFRLLGVFLAGGIPEDVVLQVARVMADAQGRIADAIARLFHLYVHEQRRAAEGAGGTELMEVTSALGAPLVGLIQPAILYFHRKAWVHAMREDMMLHLAEETTGPGAVPGQFERAILFVDLSSFTPLTEAMGDDAAAHVVHRFSDLVREATAHCGGQVVKQIGDEFMLVFPDGRTAVRCGLQIRAAANAESRFPALRIGAHVGPVLYREGDFVGSNVNIASRVTSAAARNQFVVTAAVAAQIGDLVVETTALGPRVLKGLSEPMDLFEIRDPSLLRDRSIDPVCGMELEEAAAEAELTWRSSRLLFCTEACLRRFLDDPHRYSAAWESSSRPTEQQAQS
jgi:adenylate cyclase